MLLDPPFDTDFGINAIKFIIDNNMLTDNGIIMYEKLYEANFDISFYGYDVKQKKYGTVGVVKISRV